MPTRVIVVKRARRRFFAAPRGLPDWFRALRIAFSRDRRDAPRELQTKDPIETPWVGEPVVPSLVREPDGKHRCTGCELCVRVCPSRCLSLELAEGAIPAHGSAMEDADILRFDLEAARCIGCSACAEACPEQALEMIRAPRVELAPRPGSEAIARDLLGADAPWAGG